MQFRLRKRRQPLTIIIISLIDILIVLLIFLTATTTFKQQPAIQITLPESKQAQLGSSDSRLIVTINRVEPYLYLGPEAVTLDALESELKTAVLDNPELKLSILTDQDAPFGQFVNVWDAARAARIRSISAFTKSPAGPQ